MVNYTDKTNGVKDFQEAGKSMKESLPINQKVIVIPIENEMNLEELAAGVLRKYARPALTEQEKDVWSKAAMNKHEGE